MIRWATERPAVVWASSVALLLAGGVAFTRLPLATRGQVELPTLNVSAEWPGAAAELVEMYLTSPIEAAIQPVRGVKSSESTSFEGSAQIRVELEEGTDVQLARLNILERMEVLRPELPAGSSGPTVSNYVPDGLEEEPLLRFIVSGPYTPGALKDITDEQLVPRISAAKGVAGVMAYGGASIGISVAYDGDRLRALDSAPEALRVAITNSRLVRGVGEHHEGALQLAVRIEDQPAVLAELDYLPVTGPGGLVHRLGDLATIRPEEDDRGYFYRMNGRTAVGLFVSRLAGADAIKTAARVRDVVNEVEAELPAGVQVQLQSDESVDLAKQLRELVIRGSIAFVAVLLVLALSLRNLRSVGLVMGSVAVAIAGTALGLYLLDIPANLLTLAGLGMGIGILVQNGLVVVQQMRETPDTVSGRAAASRRILPAVVGATLTTAVVLFPFLYLQGNARATFIPFAAAFALALAWSIVASVVMIPALGEGHGMHQSGWPRSRRLYERIVQELARWRWMTLVFAAAFVGLMAWGFVRKVPKSSFGAFFYGQRTVLSARLSFPRGSDPASLDRGMREFEALVVGTPGVEHVETRGSPDGAYMQVVFEQEAGLGPLPYELQEALTQRALLIGGASVSVQGRGPGFYGGSGGGGVSNYRIKLLGYSFDGVEQLAMDLKRRLERIPRVRDVDINAGSFYSRERAVSVVLEPDRAALARYGLTSQDFGQAVSREVRGAVGAQVIEVGGEETSVMLKRRGARDRTLAQLEEAMLPSPLGSPVRLGDVATVSEVEGLSSINREDQQYVRIVGYEFRGPPKLAQRTHDGFMETISVPPGYWVGDQVFEWERDDSTKGLWLVFGVGVILVVLAVAMVFDSVWAAAIVFLSLPVSLGGVVAAFWIAEEAFAREAAVGVILVVGLAVNQAILLVDAALEKRRLGGSAARRLGVREVVAAAGERSGMIVLVTFTTLASLLPLAVGTDSASLFGAIALATVGGTVAGTLGAMFVVPAMVGGGRGRR